MKVRLDIYSILQKLCVFTGLSLHQPRSQLPSKIVILVIIIIIIFDGLCSALRLTECLMFIVTFEPHNPVNRELVFGD